jgi:hypothetical protein
MSDGTLVRGFSARVTDGSGRGIVHSQCLRSFKRAAFSVFGRRQIYSMGRRVRRERPTVNGTDDINKFRVGCDYASHAVDFMY